MTWIDAPDGVLAFRRGADFVCVVNYNDYPVTLPAGLDTGQTILCSGESGSGTLPAAAATWLRIQLPSAGRD